MTADLMAFLRARLDEDQQLARDADADKEDDWWWGPDSESACERHVARHDPSRILAEVETKRRIIDEIVPRMNEMDDQIDSEWGTGDPIDYESETLLRLLALPFADHPDYRDEWRPTA